MKYDTMLYQTSSDSNQLRASSTSLKMFGFTFRPSLPDIPEKSDIILDIPIKPPQSASPTAAPVTNFEDILSRLGGFGLFQFLSLILILVLEIPAAFISMIPLFVSNTPATWYCGGVPMNRTEICGCAANASRTPALQYVGTSIVVEWDLICAHSWVPDFITSVGMVGMLFGNLVACKLSDWYGRRLTFLGVCVLMGAGHLLSGFAPNPYFYATCRLLAVVGLSGFLGISSIYALEFQTPRWRQICGSVGPWGEGVMLLALLAYQFRDWRQLTLLTCTPFLLILLIFPLLPESPRWLIRNQRLTDAHKVLCYIAKVNRTTPVDISVVKKVAHTEFEASSQESAVAVKRFNYLDFFRDPALRLPTLYQMTIMCSSAITYYGISFNVRNMEGSMYLIVALLGLSDVLGYPSALLISNRLGRRTSLAIYMSLGALFLGSLAVLELSVHLVNVPTSVIVLCLLGKFCVAGGRSCARTLVGELYPTAVRSMGSGLSGVGAGLGAIVAPQLAYLGSNWPSAPYFVFAFIAVTGALFSFLLTETMDKPLSDDVSETTSCDCDSVSVHEREFTRRSPLSSMQILAMSHR